MSLGTSSLVYVSISERMAVMESPFQHQFPSLVAEGLTENDR